MMARFLILVCVAVAAISPASAAALSSAVPTSTTGFNTVAPFYNVIAPGTGTTIEAQGPAATHVPGSSGNRTMKALGSGFKDSCSWWGGIYGTSGSSFVATMQATCRSVAGSDIKTTSLDLNRCIVNDNGHMRCQSNGGFLGSCQPINSPGTGDSVLSAICRSNNGASNRLQFDLNDCIGNDDGNLVC